MSTQSWTEIIDNKKPLFKLGLDEVWRYRDLLILLVRRDFVAAYKQTVLGPLWFFVQPLLTTVTFTIIFGNIAKLQTAGVPPMLFYLSGLTLWGYFADCLTKTSSVFRDNAAVFGKVYFPRVIMPLSVVISNLFRLVIQACLFIAFWIYYKSQGATISIGGGIWLLPVMILVMGLLGLGAGLVISALTTKYRDLSFLVTFLVQLLMYATPVIYSVAAVPVQYRALILLNPVAPIIEAFRSVSLGGSEFHLGYFIYSVLFSVLLLFIGLWVFNRVEKSFMDTV